MSASFWKGKPVLQAVLLLAGLVMVALGVNVGFGGIRTLGLQGGGDFFQVLNADAFTAQDNHIRFLGGFWLGAGLFVLAGAFWLRQLGPVLIAIAVMVFVGGLARLSVLDSDIVLSGAVLPSLLTELIAFPLLGLWVLRATRTEGAEPEIPAGKELQDR